jgi:hypothetical protein
MSAATRPVVHAILHDDPASVLVDHWWTDPDLDGYFSDEDPTPEGPEEDDYAAGFTLADEDGQLCLTVASYEVDEVTGHYLDSSHGSVRLDVARARILADALTMWANRTDAA